MSMSARTTIDLEQAWDLIQKGITKLKNNLEGLAEEQLSVADNMMLYTTFYNMWTQKRSHDYPQELYDKYRDSFEEYIVSKVQPDLRERHDEFMLRELVKRWANHKIMVRWLSYFFRYLDRYFIVQKSLPPLNAVGLTCFREMVYKETNGKVRDAVISLIDQEREGEQIDRDLLKKLVDIFVEIGIDCYENDFEAAMLKDAASYYSRKASKWILELSYLDYMLKVAECLKRERERVAHYLHSSSEPKLLEKVQHELLSVYANQLLEKEHSGCYSLLRDKEEKIEDLPIKPTKEVFLKSSDGDIFAVDYNVALMLESIKDMVEYEANSTANSSIPLKVSSKILIKIIEYCHKHAESSDSEDKTSGTDLKEWDAKFVEVDNATLSDLILASNDLNIKSLQDLACQKVGDLISMLNIRDEFHPKEEKEEFLKEIR
ncbi:hypothetical protein QN277_026750 [Acacia crassicarpa]|uniref:Uncharacterized protein n=1 Tax=Acacia crassicarpa TaxID=499986 RepID=A0AAE1MM93_9FABA|nr:hypothetical protein QN277_026750 [Acacia crassicarpa]